MAGTRKHLTMADRQTIEQMLNDKEGITQIANALGKHPSCISREIKETLNNNSVTRSSSF